MRDTLRQFWLGLQALLLAIAVHILAALLIVLGTMDWRPFKPPDMTALTIEAVIVDTSQIIAARQEAEQAQRRAEAERLREEQLAEQRERERQRAAERAAEEERQRQAEEAERQRQQQEAERKRREEDQRLQRLREQQERERQEQLERQQRELEEVRRQRAEAERQRRLEEERLKQLEARRQREAEAERQAQLEAERQKQLEALAAQQRAGRLATKQEEYILVIQAQVTQNWLRPPTAKPGLRCRLRVVQIPGGEVISASIAGSCNADEATRRSLIAAVERTGTLPYRGYEDVFEREIDFIFRYDGD